MAKSLVTKRKTLEFEIHPYDMRIERTYKLIEHEVSKSNVKANQFTSTTDRISGKRFRRYRNILEKLSG